MRRNQYTKVNDKKVLHKVKKQWVVISSAILMAMSSGMVINHITHKLTPVTNTIETQASGLHNHLLQSSLRAHADTTTQTPTSGQSINSQNTLKQSTSNTSNTNNIQSANSSVNPQQQPVSQSVNNVNNGQSTESAVTIETSRGPVAVSNTPYNVQVAKQQQATNSQNASTNGNPYQSNGFTNVQNALNNGQSVNPSVNPQQANANGQGSVTIETSRGPVAVSNTPYNVQIAKEQAAASAQNASTGSSLSSKSSNSVSSSSSHQSVSHSSEKRNPLSNSAKTSSNNHLHINLRGTPPKKQLSENEQSQHKPVWYTGQNGQKSDIAPGAWFNVNNVKRIIKRNPHMQFYREYDVTTNLDNDIQESNPVVPYTLDGSDDLFKNAPIAKNWGISSISDGHGHDINNLQDQLQGKFYYEKPNYQFHSFTNEYMYTFSPNYVKSNSDSYTQIPSGKNFSNPIMMQRLHIYNNAQQDTVKFKGVKPGTIVNNLAIGNVGNDFNDNNLGLNFDKPVNIFAPIGNHFVANGKPIFNNYVKPNQNPGYIYGQNDNYSDSDGNGSDGNYYKHFNIGTIDGSFITLNVHPDTANVVYTYNGNRVDTKSIHSDNYTYSDNKYKNDKNGNPIAGVITPGNHPGLPSDVGYHLVNPSTSVPFNNGDTDVPIEPNTFDFNYVDNNNNPVIGQNQTGSDYNYDQTKDPSISDIINNDIKKDVPSGYTLVSGQTNHLSYNNTDNPDVHHLMVVPTSSLKKTIHRTIHYENDNNQPPHDIAKTVSQSLTYDRTASMSNGSASYSPFTYSSGTGTWSAVATPNLSYLGYQSAEPPYTQEVPSEDTPNGNSASSDLVDVWYPDSDVTVTPSNPGYPNSKIPDGSSTWPPGTAESDLAKTITRTIEYHNSDGREISKPVYQNVIYTQSMKVDKVTGRIVPHSRSPWYTSDNVWAQVDSPNMSGQGYGTPYVYYDTANKLLRNSVAKSIPSDNNVRESDHNRTIDIRYPDAITTVTPSDPQTPGAKINPNSNVTWPKGTDANSLIHKITRTVNYVNTKGQILAPSVTQAVKYTKTVNVDRVTGKIISNTPWTADKGKNSWPSITSPDMSKEGYGTPYTFEKNSTIIPQSQQTTNVPEEYIPSDYTEANDETIDVLYPDASTIVTPSDAKTPGTKINPNSNVVWPSGTDLNSLTRKVTRTIHYVNNRGQKVAPSDVQNVTFNRAVKVDDVTGNIVNQTGWSTNNNAWSDVTSPDLSRQGYGKPDKASVAKKVVNVSDPDDNVTVTYPDNENNQTIPKTITRTIYYRDAQTGKEIADPVTQKVIYTHVVKRNAATGQVNSDWETNHNTWSDVTSPNLSIQGYSAPNPSSVPAVTVNPNGSDQTVVVTYDPGTMIIYPNGVDNRLSRTTTQTINYVGPDGKEIPGVPPNKQTIHFNRTAVVDRVTGQIISYSKWQPSNGYVAVDSPDETSRGYIYPNQSVINGNNPQSPDIGNTTITVQYQQAKPSPTPSPAPTPAPSSEVNEPSSSAPAPSSSAQQPQPSSAPSSSSSQSSSSSSIEIPDDIRFNPSFKPLRRPTSTIPRPKRHDDSYPFIKLDTRNHAAPRREDRHLPQTGEDHDYSSLFGAIMTLTATLIAALGEGLDRRRNK